MTLNELLHYTKSKAEWHLAESKRLDKSLTFEDLSQSLIHGTKAEVYSEIYSKIKAEEKNAPIPSPE